MIQFLNPVWLWALGGVMIPIGIHLLSRKEGKVFLMGSIRFLSETPTSKFRSLRLNEVLLLSIRCIVIILAVFFVAGLTFQSESREKWLLIEPDLEGNEHVDILHDSLRKEGYQTRLLFPGFPFETDSSVNVGSYWSLVEALGKRPLEDVVILSRQKLANFKGERIALPSNVKWINIPYIQQKDFVTDMGLKGSTSDFITSFENDVPLTSFPRRDSIRVSIFSGPAYDFDKDVLVAVLKSIQEMSGTHVDIEVNPSRENPRADWHFYLDTIASRKENNIITMSFSTGFARSLLERDHTRRGSFVITNRLTPDLVLDEKFTIQLAHILFEGRDSVLMAHPDNRVMPDQMLWKAEAEASVTTFNDSPIAGTPWLPFALVTVLILERYVSKKRKQ